jgi:opacity protein-like surface antigen
MVSFLLGAVLALAASLSVVAARALRAQAAAAAELAEQLRALQTRLEEVEAEASRTSLRADVAETVLLEKGVADEEDLEEARRYFERHAQPRWDRDRDGDLQ